MDEITVTKDRLLGIMKHNREKHHEIVLEAQAGFRKAVIKRLDEMLDLAANGQKIDLHIGLSMPEDHTEEYDTIIGMLELDINEAVKLDQRQYRAWVEDKWGWEQSFYGTNAFYSATAATHV